MPLRFRGNAVLRYAYYIKLIENAGVYERIAWNIQ
jgi:hypothetical protein